MKLMNSRILGVWLILLAFNSLNAMQSSITKEVGTNNEVKYRDPDTGYWVRYDPNKNTYEGRFKLWHGTYQEIGPEGKCVPVEPTQDEARLFYELLEKKFHSSQ